MMDALVSLQITLNIMFSMFKFLYNNLQQINTIIKHIYNNQDLIIKYAHITYHFGTLIENEIQQRLSPSEETEEKIDDILNDIDELLYNSEQVQNDIDNDELVKEEEESLNDDNININEIFSELISKIEKIQKVSLNNENPTLENIIFEVLRKEKVNNDPLSVRDTVNNLKEEIKKLEEKINKLL
jgi:hypothetical protein